MGALLEREDELSRLEALLALAQGGSGSCALIEGPAGIGKTQLVANLRERARERGMRVLSARGGELEIDFPYGVVRQLLDAAPRPGGELFEVLDGLHRQVQEATVEGPALLAVDDLQWADAPSLRFLIYLQRRLEALPVLLLLSARTGEEAADARLLDQLAGDESVTLVRPAPLSERATAAIVEMGCGGEPGPRFVAACQAATGGNPFLLNALVSALADEATPPEDRHADRVAEVGPRGVARSVLRRLGRMDAHAIALAQALAVLGGEADLRIAAALAGLDGTAATAAADALTRAELTGPGRPLAFVHPLIRSAIYHDLAPGERALRHAEAARLLEGEAAVAHLLETEASGDAATVATLREAAAAGLERGATEAAARLLRRVLREPPAPGELPQVLRDLGEAEVLAGDPAPAIVHLRQALELCGDPADGVEIALALRQALVVENELEGAVAALDAAVARHPSASRELEPAAVAILVLTPRLARRELDRIDRLVASADAAGPSAAAVAAAALALRGGSPERAAALANRSLADPALLSGPGRYYAAFFAIVALWLTDRVAEAAAEADRLRAAMLKVGALPMYLATLGYRARIAFRADRIEDAAADVEQVIEIAGLYGQTAYHRMVAGAAIELHVVRGRLDEAERVLAAAGPEMRAQSFFSALLLLARGRLRAAQGRHREALDDFLALGRLESDAVRAPSLWPWRSEAALALVATGEPERAAALAAEEVELARAAETPRALAAALRAHSVATGHAALLDEAERALYGVEAPLLLAGIRVEQGVLLRRARRPTEARQPLRAAIDTAERLGAVRLADRARAELAATGVRAPVRRASRDELTPGERRVAELAAAGRTNDEIAGELFLTRRTVETHLTHTYRKLGITSRAALAHALRDAG